MITVREWRLRVHQTGTDVPDDGTVALTLDETYLPEPPSGIGSQTLRLLEGKVESQPYTIRIADPNGEITAFTFGGGRLQMVGRWVEVQTRIDGGDWTRADLRRISRVASPDPVSWEWELALDSSLLKDRLFERSSDIQLYPLGPAFAWHRHPSAGFSDPLAEGLPGRIAAVSGDLLQIRLPTGYRIPRDLVGVLRDHLETLRLERGGVQYRVVSFGASTPANIDEAMGTWLGDPPLLPEGVWIEWPGHGFSQGDSIGQFRLWWPEGVPTSPVTPRLIGPVIDPDTGEVAGTGYRLDALVRDVLDGEYGGRRMYYAAAAIEALADLGDEGHWFVIDGPIPRGDFLREYVWRPYVIAPQTLPDGALSAAAVWAGDSVSTAGLYRFGAHNVQGPVRFEAGGSDVANVWQLSAQHADPRLPAEAEILPVLDLSEVIRVRSAVDAVHVEQPYELALAHQVLRRVWSDAAPDLYSARIFALAGDGATVYRVTAAVEETSPLPGDLVVLSMGELGGPEAQTASRDGERVAVVMERTRVYGPGSLHYSYLLWDTGWRAHSIAHGDTAHADTHSDSNQPGHLDVHADEHIDLHADSDHRDYHGDGSHSDYHEDAAHADGPAHTDLHQDASHGDTHGDTKHSDTHSDAGHGDSHGDAIYRLDDLGHCDFIAIGEPCFHGDTHSDSGHQDYHADTLHTDVHSDSEHVDGHADIDHQDGGHADYHDDTQHSDVHADAGHVDDHADLAHTDLHQDGAHEDVHDDVLHTDWTDFSAHQDDHADLGHQDVHADSEHGDSHGDVEHVDFSEDWHGDSHQDAGHGDGHGDTPGDPVHSDDHQDITHQDEHDDTAHADEHADTQHGDHHSDVPPENDHGDFHGRIDPDTQECGFFGIEPCHVDHHFDQLHSDSHSDTGHTDTHSDGAHTDAHDDIPHFDDHLDTPQHADEHSDQQHGDHHGDGHGDTPHTDTPHQDTHSDGGHSDTHTDSDHTDTHADAGHGDAHRDQPHSDVHADLTN